MKTHLRLLGLTFAAEARILKRLAKQAPHPDLRNEFGGALRHNCRVKARATHLALGFIRGRKLVEIERPHRPYKQGHVTSKGMTRTSPDWELVEALVFAHGVTYFDSVSQMLQKFAEFVEGVGVDVSVTERVDEAAMSAVEG